MAKPRLRVGQRVTVTGTGGLGLAAHSGPGTGYMAGQGVAEGDSVIYTGQRQEAFDEDGNPVVYVQVRRRGSDGQQEEVWVAEDYLQPAGAGGRRTMDTTQYTPGMVNVPENFVGAGGRRANRQDLNWASNWFQSTKPQKGATVYVMTSEGDNLATYERRDGKFVRTEARNLPEGTELTYTGKRTKKPQQTWYGTDAYFVQVQDANGNTFWVAENWVGDNTVEQPGGSTQQPRGGDAEQPRGGDAEQPPIDPGPAFTQSAAAQNALFAGNQVPMTRFGGGLNNPPEDDGVKNPPEDGGSEVPWQYLAGGLMATAVGAAAYRRRRRKNDGDNRNDGGGNPPEEPQPSSPSNPQTYALPPGSPQPLALPSGIPSTPSVVNGRPADSRVLPREPNRIPMTSPPSTSPGYLPMTPIPPAVVPPGGYAPLALPSGIPSTSPNYVPGRPADVRPRRESVAPYGTEGYGNTMSVTASSPRAAAQMYAVQNIPMVREVQGASLASPGYSQQGMLDYTTLQSMPGFYTQGAPLAPAAVPVATNQTAYVASPMGYTPYAATPMTPWTPPATTYTPIAAQQVPWSSSNINPANYTRYRVVTSTNPIILDRQYDVTGRQGWVNIYTNPATRPAPTRYIVHSPLGDAGPGGGVAGRYSGATVRAGMITDPDNP